MVKKVFLLMGEGGLVNAEYRYTMHREGREEAKG